MGLGVVLRLSQHGEPLLLQGPGQGLGIGDHLDGVFLPERGHLGQDVRLGRVLVLIARLKQHRNAARVTRVKWVRRPRVQYRLRHARAAATTRPRASATKISGIAKTPSARTGYAPAGWTHRWRRPRLPPSPTATATLASEVVSRGV